MASPRHDFRTQTSNGADILPLPTLAVHVLVAIERVDRCLLARYRFPLISEFLAALDEIAQMVFYTRSAYPLS